jgi:hypothetical protein
MHFQKGHAPEPTTQGCANQMERQLMCLITQEAQQQEDHDMNRSVGNFHFHGLCDSIEQALYQFNPSRRVESPS